MAVGLKNYSDSQLMKFISNINLDNYSLDEIIEIFKVCLNKSKVNSNMLEITKNFKSKINNEIIDKMYNYFIYKQSGQKHIHKNVYKKPLLLEGDNLITLSTLEENSIHLIFTSPPYYNARDYSQYKSYENYLNKMYLTLVECYRILEEGRFIIINISPVISKRPDRNYESIRYPLHFDFHNLLVKAGFYFMDEIIWIKPEPSVKNRIGNYYQIQTPLTYKPNCITESLLVYRKSSPFLIGENLRDYDISIIKKEDSFETSNCWNICPVSNKNHPAVFPEELCRRILRFYSFPNDSVLDCFAGSGTFGRIAINMNRIPILCEINESYCKLIKENIL